MNFPSSINFDWYGRTYELKGFEDYEAKEVDNLQALFSRERGDLFKVVDGRLQKIEGWRDWFSYQWNRREERANVKRVVKQSLVLLNTHLSRDQKNQKVARVAVRYLFDSTGSKGIGRCNALYNRRKLLYSDNKISQLLFPKGRVRIKLNNKFLDLCSEGLERHPAPFPFEMDLGNRVLNHNLRKLMGQKSTIYTLDEKGKLRKTTPYEQLTLDKQENAQQVEQAVSAVITSLETYLSANKINKVHKVVLKRLCSVDSTLSHLPPDVFIRENISEGSRIEHGLDSRLKQLRRTLVDALIKLRDSDVESRHRYKLSVERVLHKLTVAHLQLALRLGIDLKRISGSGSGGARFGMDRFGHIVAVVKPGDEGPDGINNPSKWTRIKHLVVSPKECLDGNSEPLAEFFAYLCDRTFEIWSVPSTSITYISSRDFVGAEHKKCSVQLYFAGCSDMGEYLGISPKIHSLPRTFLRWLLGSETHLGPFELLWERKQQREHILNSIPAGSMERVALHNFLSEDTDWHLQNSLVFEKEVTGEPTLVERIFNGDKSVSDDEIKELVATLFETQTNQQLLQSLHYSEEVEIEVESEESNTAEVTSEESDTEEVKRKRVWVIKPDGGASFPHSHPRAWDYFSLRNKHATEVLPHFDQPFSQKTIDLMEDSEEVFFQFLMEKATCDLRGIMTSQNFDTLFEKNRNKTLFRQWVFGDDNDNPELRKQLIISIAKAEKTVFSQEQIFYYNYHLKRIHKALETRIDSFRIAKNFLKSEEPLSMRELMIGVKTSKDFRRTLAECNDDFIKVMQGWREDPDN